MLWIVRANLYKQLHHKQTQHLFEYLDLSPINRKQQAQLINSLLKFQAHFFLLFLLFFSTLILSRLLCTKIGFNPIPINCSRNLLERVQKRVRPAADSVRTANRVKSKEMGRNVKIGFLAETSSTRCEFQINNKNTLYLCYFWLHVE